MSDQNKNVAQDEQEAAKRIAELTFDSVRESLLILTDDLRVKVANSNFYQTFQVSPEKTTGRLVYELGNGQWDIPRLRELLEELLPKNDTFDGFEVEHRFESIGYRVMLLNARRLDHQQMILLAIEDATDRMKAERELKDLTAMLEQRVKERTNQVRALSSALTMSEQKERRRIARLLHDDLQQQLYAMRMKLSPMRLAAERGDREVVLRELEQCDDWLATAMRMTRDLTVELVPPALKTRSLAQVLEALAQQMTDVQGLQVSTRLEDDATIHDETVLGLLYQVVRELLFNVSKHAGVKEADVELSREREERVIRVCDEGRGFAVDEASSRPEIKSEFGLFSLSDRLDHLGGKVEIDSAPGNGTRVTVRVPASLGV